MALRKQTIESRVLNVSQLVCVRCGRGMRERTCCVLAAFAARESPGSEPIGDELMSLGLNVMGAETLPD